MPTKVKTHPHQNLEFPDWSGETVAVVAGGLSARDLAPRIRGCVRTIVVNLAFRLIPEADALYVADSGFWTTYRDACTFQGLKLSPAAHAHSICPSIQRVEIARNNGRNENRMQRDPVGVIGVGGGNGGFQAINLAVQFGATRILIAGIDYAGTHWHDDHGRGLKNPSTKQLANWRAHLDAESNVLQSWGVEVINLSSISSLRAYPYVDPDRILPRQRQAAL